jgi:DNA polymerase-1
MLPKLRGLLTGKIAVAHNAQFDLTVLAQAGFDLPTRTYDTMLGAYVLFTHWRGALFTMPDTGEKERGNMQLKWLGRMFGLAAKAEYGLTGDEAELQEAAYALQDKINVGYALDIKKHLWALPVEAVAPYAMMDVELTYKLHEKLSGLLEKWQNRDLYERLSDVQINVAYRMSKTGLRVNTSQAALMIETGEKQLETLREAAQTESGLSGFNPASPKQIKEYLASIGISVPSTDKTTIKDLSKRVPLMQIVKDYRDTNKLVNTYIRKWHNAAEHAQGLIHPSLNAAFVKTGRWSSSNAYTGNLQNIPRNTAKALAPKSLLQACNPDWWLFEIDYSGLEMCIGAWVAETLIGKGEDLTITHLIENGEDMHAYTRDTVGVPELLLGGDVTEDRARAWLEANGVNLNKLKTDVVSAFMTEARTKAKTANFLIMYGGGVPALTDTLGIDAQTATRILAGWHRAYPAIPAAMEKLENAAKTYRNETGDGPGKYAYVRYPLDEFALIRKYHYYSLYDQQKEARNCFNSVTQGTAGGITVLSADRISRAYPYDAGLKLHLTVHDSVLLSLPPGGLSNLRPICDLMTDWNVRPRLNVDVEAVPPGGGWADKRAINDLEAFSKSEGKDGYD